VADDGLVAALARAQKAMSHPKKTKTNPHFKSDYADLADVLNAVRPALNEQGIAIVQTVDNGDLVTELRYNDEVIASRLPLNLDVKPQELGSQLSYLRRYALSAIVGVASEADDDGNAAQTAPVRAFHPQAKAAPDAPPDDWETRPLASMSFAELRAVALELNHPFSGGSKAELIRQLEPLVRARSGAEPFDLTGAEPVPGDGGLGTDGTAASGFVEPHDRPFTPTTFDEDLRAKPPSARQSIRNSLREPE
jgi:hypothetical protein